MPEHRKDVITHVNHGKKTPGEGRNRKDEANADSSQPGGFLKAHLQTASMSCVFWSFSVSTKLSPSVTKH